MKIVVSGSTGLIGQALVLHLKKLNHDVVCLVRKKSETQNNSVYWNPLEGIIDLEALENTDVMIHLAGYGITEKRWTEEIKSKIKFSRVKGTRFLVQSLLKLKNPPQTFLMASAVGFYGDRAQEMLTEKSQVGNGFLPEVCKAWEDETQPLTKKSEKQTRVAFMRFGTVLSLDGGALQKILPAFKAGFGGKIGNGRQYMSWISLDDVVEIFIKALDDSNFSGPINVTTPQPVVNKDFTKILSHVLKRPAFFRIPKIVVKMFLGQMGNDLLLASTFAYPEKLMSLHYNFRYPELKNCLNNLLKK